MNKEITSLILLLRNTLSGEPWFGRSITELLLEIQGKKVYQRPLQKEHSLIELLYHMITWAEFTLNRIEQRKETDVTAIEKIDWRIIDPSIHTWENAVQEFLSLHNKIISLLVMKEDAFLEGVVDYREYNFRFLLNGLIQHNIYHIGQIAYVNKLLDE